MTKPMMTFEEYCTVNMKLNIPREAQFAIYQDYVAACERASAPAPLESPLTHEGEVKFYSNVNISVVSKLKAV